MGMREKLIELTNDVLKYLPWGQISSHTARELADHLIANGATIPVRCKECKHYEDHKLKIFENCVRKGRLIPMKPDDFCSYGERRTDGNA